MPGQPFGHGAVPLGQGLNQQNVTAGGQLFQRVGGLHRKLPLHFAGGQKAALSQVGPFAGAAVPHKGGAARLMQPGCRRFAGAARTDDAVFH